MHDENHESHRGRRLLLQVGLICGLGGVLFGVVMSRLTSRRSCARRPPCVRRVWGNAGKGRDGHKKANRQNLPRLWPFSYLGRIACRFTSVAEAEDNPPTPLAVALRGDPARRAACLSLW